MAEEWTPIEAEIYEAGKTESYADIAKRLGMTSAEIKMIYETAHEKFQTFDEDFRIKFNGSDIGNAWKKEEDDVLREFAKRKAMYLEVTKEFPNRSEKSVARRYTKIKIEMGIKNEKKPWRAEDDEELKRLNDQGMNLIQIALQMNRSEGCISEKLFKLTGERRSAVAWSPEEVRTIVDGIKDNKTAKVVCEKLPQRTYKSVLLKMNEMRREMNAPNASKTWTEQEENDLIETYLSGETQRQMAERFGRSRKSICNKLERLRKKGKLYASR